MIVIIPAMVNPNQKGVLRMVADKKSPNQNKIFVDFHAVSLPTPNSKQSSKPSKAPCFGLVNDVFHLKTGRAGARALQRGALEVLEALAPLQKLLALALLWWIWIGTCHQGSKAPNGKKHQRHSAEGETGTVKVSANAGNGCKKRNFTNHKSQVEN